MFKSNTSEPAAAKIDGWSPAIVALSAIVPILAIVFLSKQPKEVTATVYSAYIAIMAVPAAVIARKKGKRAMAIIALFTCVVFSVLFVTYAYIAFDR